jgi:hypothetical protein
MRATAIAFFLAGLLLWIRVMFFGVQRRVDDDRVDHRRWPLAGAALFATMGILLYARPVVTAAWVATVAIAGLAASVGAWWFVKRSAEIPSTDPEDDPRYRFQGHVARVTHVIEGTSSGRVVFTFDGRQIELRARWSPESGIGSDRTDVGRVNDEVVIERIDDDLAYVEPWVIVEQRL